MLNIIKTNVIIYNTIVLNRIIHIFVKKLKMKVPKIVSVMHRKGGVGKSTTTMILATLLSSQGKRVVVLDLDEKNLSSFKVRQKNIELINKLSDTTKVKRMYNRMVAQNELYEIKEVAPNDLPKVIEMIKSNNDSLKIDYVFIDSPGGVEDNGFQKTIKLAEHILIPLVNDDENEENTVEYYLSLKALKSKLPKLKTLHIFFNNIQYTLEYALKLLAANKITESEYFATIIERNKDGRGNRLKTIIPATNQSYIDFTKEFERKIK
jgi:cellulose biosynthesis protein BcsQ